MYRINELVRVATEWKRATELKHASPSRPPKTLGPDAWFDMWRIINETRMTRNSRTFLGLNFDTLSTSLQMFRTMAERNKYRIRARYLRALNSGGTSAGM